LRLLWRAGGAGYEKHRPVVFVSIEDRVVASACQGLQIARGGKQKTCICTHLWQAGGLGMRKDGDGTPHGCAKQSDERQHRSGTRMQEQGAIADASMCVAWEAAVRISSASCAAPSPHERRARARRSLQGYHEAG
jgi:hypothetical protein